MSQNKHRDQGESVNQSGRRKGALRAPRSKQTRRAPRQVIWSVCSGAPDRSLQMSDRTRGVEKCGYETNITDYEERATSNSNSGAAAPPIHPALLIPRGWLSALRVGSKYFSSLSKQRIIHSPPTKKSKIKQIICFIYLLLK